MDTVECEVVVAVKVVVVTVVVVFTVVIVVVVVVAVAVVVVAVVVVVVVVLFAAAPKTHNACGKILLQGVPISSALDGPRTKSLPAGAARGGAGEGPGGHK